MIRSGRMRRLLRTRSRIVTSPLPSTLAGRASSEITCGCWSWSSAASSIVTIRSRSRIAADSAFSSVVLPAPVPPEMTTFRRARTNADSSLRVGSSSDPRSTSSPRVNFLGKRRIVRTGPISERGGMMTLTRSPLGRRASTIGLASSTRRLTCETIRSIV